MTTVNLQSPKYTRVINAALRRPWCITEEMKATIFDVLVFRAKGGRLTAEEIRARIGDDDDEEASPRRVLRTIRPSNGAGGGAVSVVPVYGVIAHRTFEASSGMTSTEMISAMLQRALNDGETSSILLDISSPGGGVEGVPELAAEIFAARKMKPITAIANNLAASAAYWIGSQADELIVIPSGQVGSIGVFSLHEDWSAWLEKEGIKITAMSAGEKKLEGNPWEPLDTEARAHFQKQVDEVYADFIRAVAKGRGVAQAKVKSDFGQGRVFTADEAASRDMVDGIATFDETVVRLMSTKGRRRGAAAAESAEASLPRRASVDDSQEVLDQTTTVPKAGQQDGESFEALQLVAVGMRMALDLEAERD
jgi:signal peptide peptidase SppA